MNRLVTILTILLISSCTSRKNEVMSYFSEIKELNNILLKNQNMLEWMNNPDSISLNVSGTKEIIQSLKENINLTQIESHDTVVLKANIQKAGLAYYFGNRASKNEDYMILIFGEDEKTLEIFKYYEQFSDCSKKENLNNNWEFVTVDPDCYK